MSTNTTPVTEEPTPETDALIAVKSGFGPTDFEWRNHARRLERQRNAARAELSRVYQWIERNHPDGFIDSQTHRQNLERITELHHDLIDLKDAKIKAMHDAIKEAYDALELWPKAGHGISTDFTAQSKAFRAGQAALANLKFFIQPT